MHCTEPTPQRRCHGGRFDELELSPPTDIDAGSGALPRARGGAPAGRQQAPRSGDRRRRPLRTLVDDRHPIERPARGRGDRGGRLVRLRRPDGRNVRSDWSGRSRSTTASSRPRTCATGEQISVPLHRITARTSSATSSVSPDLQHVAHYPIRPAPYHCHVDFVRYADLAAGLVNARLESPTRIYATTSSGRRVAAAPGSRSDDLAPLSDSSRELRPVFEASDAGEEAERSSRWSTSCWRSTPCPPTSPATTRRPGTCMSPSADRRVSACITAECMMGLAMLVVTSAPPGSASARPTSATTSSSTPPPTSRRYCSDGARRGRTSPPTGPAARQKAPHHATAETAPHDRRTADRPVRQDPAARGRPPAGRGVPAGDRARSPSSNARPSTSTPTGSRRSGSGTPGPPATTPSRSSTRC